MAWIELRFDATDEAVDWVKTLLSAQHYAGEMQLSPYQPESLETMPAWQVSVCLSLPDTWQSQQQVEQVVQRLSPLYRTGLISEPDYAVVDIKPEFSSVITHRVGDRFVILGADAPDPTDSTLIPLKLDGSLAFGSGLHPATQLSLQLVERYLQPNMQTLDLGCGSGILSLAMAKLGAQVLALDNDTVAVSATQTAAQLNGVSSKITAQVGSLGAGSDLGHWMGDDLEAVAKLESEQSFDLIAANILGRIHTALAKDYRDAVKPKGLLLTAGFTTDYEVEVETALKAEGFEPVAHNRIGEWVAIAFQKVNERELGVNVQVL